jgi:hypothetical protein
LSTLSFTRVRGSTSLHFAGSGTSLVVAQDGQSRSKSPPRVYSLQGGTLLGEGVEGRGYSAFGLATDGSALFWVDENEDKKNKSLWGCALEDCRTPRQLSAKASGAVALANDRVYFAEVRTVNGRSLALLESCVVSEALAGTCVPTVHAAGTEWANVQKLLTDSGYVYGVSAGKVWRAAR